MNFKLSPEKLIFLLFIIFAFSIFAFLMRWQILDNKYWLALTNGRIFTANSAGLRGRILSSDGSTLAYSEFNFDIYIYKPNLESLESSIPARQTRKEFILKIAGVLNMLPSELEEKLNNPQISNVLIASNISVETKNKLETLETENSTAKTKLYLTGLDFIETQKRIYPNDTLAAHILGYLGKNSNGESKPSGGVEALEDGNLKGLNGFERFEKSQNGNIIPTSQVEELQPKSGNDIKLTINRGVQKVLEEKLAEGAAKYNAEDAVGIIINPKTGEIIAAAIAPTFDPNNYSKVENNRILNNTIFTEPYEIGSVGKPFTASAALNENLLDKDTIVEPSHNGCITLDNQPICVALSTLEITHRKNLSLTSTLLYSDNIGSYRIADIVGEMKMKEYLKRFGVGQNMQTGLIEEGTGSLNEAKWKSVDIATNSFGQSYTMTPLQLIYAYSTFANNGKIMRPKLISEIIDSEDKNLVKLVPNKLDREILSENTVNTINEILTVNFSKTLKNNYGQNTEVFEKISKYKIAMKTGTAEIRDPETGLYLPSPIYNTTVMGYDSSGKGQFVMLIKLSKPKGGVHNFAEENAYRVWIDTFYGVSDLLGVVEE